RRRRRRKPSRSYPASRLCQHEHFAVKSAGWRWLSGSCCCKADIKHRPTGETVGRVNITGQLAEIFAHIGVKSTYGTPVDRDVVRSITVAAAGFVSGAGEGIRR